MSENTILAKSATLSVNDRILTIREVSIEECLLLFEKEAHTPQATSDIVVAFKKLLPMVIAGEGIDSNWLLKLAPSQFRAIWEKFKEVNADFLLIAEFLGIVPAAKEIINQTGKVISAELKEIVPTLLRQGIRTSLDTPIPFTKSPRKPGVESEKTNSNTAAKN